MLKLRGINFPLFEKKFFETRLDKSSVALVTGPSPGRIIGHSFLMFQGQMSTDEKTRLCNAIFALS